MASAQPLYRSSTFAYPSSPASHPRSLRVVRGERHQGDRLDLRLVAIARIILAIVVVFTVLGFLRVGLASATVSTNLETEQLSSQIDSARTIGNALEVQESELANPVHIKEYAKEKLGMAAPAAVESIVLGPDSVSVDSSGRLSLAQSLAVMAQGL